MKVPKSLIAGAMAIGVAVGSSGVASAATIAKGTTAAPAVVAVAPAPPRPGTPSGGPRNDATLSSEALARATAAAKAKVAGGTVIRVVRVQTADGHATYEVHLTDSHGNPATVYLDGSFQVVSTGAPS
jgi:hypothetical protein